MTMALRSWAFFVVVLLYVNETTASTSVTIKQRKTRVIKEPIPIRSPSEFQGGPMAEKIKRTTPLTRWYNLNNDGGDVSLFFFGNITHKSQSKKTILGLWKGYEGDSLKKTYRSMIYDDGDVCREEPTRRYSIVIELSKKDYSGMHEYLDTIETTSDPCTFKSKINFYGKDEEMQLNDGIDGEIPGIVQWYDDPNSPHIICKDIKCDYNEINNRINHAITQINDLKETIRSIQSNSNDAILTNVLQSSVSIVNAANDVLSHSKQVHDQLSTYSPSNCQSTVLPFDFTMDNSFNEEKIL